MDTRKFEVGAVVQLTSGGIEMTVREYDRAAPELVNCYWHSKDGKPESHWYMEKMLRRV